MSAIWEFFQDYGSWMVFGVLLVFMLRMHAVGGCGMGHGQHGEHSSAKPRPTDANADPRSGTSMPTGRGANHH